MSHSVGLVTVANRSVDACVVTGLPQIRFLDRGGRTVAASNTSVAAPRSATYYVLRPGATAAFRLRWIAGRVFAQAKCVQAESADLLVGRDRVRLAVPKTHVGVVCGISREEPFPIETTAYGAWKSR
jgi:hypothetical protein